MLLRGTLLRRTTSYCAAALCLACSSLALAAPPHPPAPGESALQSRLLAPCCWNQTLDVHESDSARSLRSEIHQRLVAGERVETIEEDLVARYGVRILAVPKGRSLNAFGGWLSFAVVLTGVGAACLVMRWLRRGRVAQRVIDRAGEPQPRDPYDDRLDAELRDLDR